MKPEKPARKIYQEPEEVTKRLSQLGAGDGDGDDPGAVTVELLHEVLQRGEASRAQASPLHPPYAGGWLAHLEMVKASRELLLAKGWRKDGPTRVSSEDGTTALRIDLGDDATGDPEYDPSTKYRKGASYDRDVYINEQLLLFPTQRLEEALPRAPGSSGVKTWTLLHRREQGLEKTVIHSELVLFYEMDGPFPGDWAERIFLPLLIVGFAPSVADLPSFDDGQEIDVPIQKK